MSTQRGNARRSRPPKYTNEKGFKNTMHDTSRRTQEINNLIMDSLCSKCKGVIEWKVKYKKYHPLSQPTKCVKCGQKNVKRAYYTICDQCATTAGVCAKCGTAAEIVIPHSEQNDLEVQREFEKHLPELRERERRTLLRIAEKSAKNSQINKRTAAELTGAESDDCDDKSSSEHTVNTDVSISPPLF
ncbi:unnamed protein product [Calicophoron daubneyi]